MLRFTAAGAVQAPTTLQVRLTRPFDGRIRAGAPEPSGAMSAAALRDNLQWFASGRGPRERACTSLVVSGAALADDVIDAIGEAPALGYTAITRHIESAGASDFLNSDLRDVATAVAIAVDGVRGLESLALMSEWSGHVTAALLLRQATLDAMDSVLEPIIAARPDRVVLTWPLTGQPPPHAEVAARGVDRALERLDAAGIASGVKGLPACRLTRPDRLWRSANRLYVDVDHQRDDALLFFPDVVRFTKSDRCRFCSADARCDGAPEAWVAAGLAGPFTPLEPGAGPGAQG